MLTKINIKKEKKLNKYIFAIIITSIAALIFSILMWRWTSQNINLIKISLFLAIAVAVFFLIFKGIPYLQGKGVIRQKNIANAVKIALSVLLLLDLVLIFFNYQIITDKDPSFSIFGTKWSYQPKHTTRDVERYKGLYFGNSPHDFFKASLAHTDYQSDLEQGRLVHPMIITNLDFEKDSNQDSWPDNWIYNGRAEYTDKNCFSGKGCIHVNIDDSDQGWFQLNSDLKIIKPGNLYNFTLHINCIKCEDQSVYMAAIWLGYEENPMNRTNFSATIVNTDMKIREYKRTIVLLNNTKGYQTFSIVAKAPWATNSYESMYGILGVRAHTETAHVMPRTEFYID